jgi:hypothetical protein
VASRLEHHPAHNRPRRPPPPPFSAGRYANLQPSSGGWRGSTLDPQAFIHSHGDDPYEYEEKYGSPVQLIRIFRNNGADNITDEYKEWACATGGIIYYSISENDWYEILSGSKDWSINGYIRAFKDIDAMCGAKMFITMKYEPELYTAGNPFKNDSIYGTAEVYKQVWRKTHDMFTAANVTNAIWAMDSLLVESLHCLTTPPHRPAAGNAKAQLAPTHPRAQPEQLESLSWPQEFASGRPKITTVHFQLLQDYSADSARSADTHAIFAALWPDDLGEEGKYVDWLFWNIFTYSDTRGWSFDYFLGRGYELFTNMSNVPQVFNGTTYTVNYLAYPCQLLRLQL